MKAIENRAPLTEAEVIEYLEQKVRSKAEQWGENDFYTNLAREYRDKQLANYRLGLVVPVYSEDYRSAYGNVTGDFSDTLFSDGHVETTCYGYSD